MTDKIRTAVVGCGYWGPNLIRNFRWNEGFDVKFICDQSPERLAHIRKLYPEVEGLTDFDLLVEKDVVDAIAIATPVWTHYPLAKKALSAGKHVFIEKPMAPSVKECEDLIRIAEQNNVKIMVGHTFVYSSHVRKIRDIINSGDLGDILYISSQRLNLGLFQKDINVSWDLAPHDLSIILYLMNEKPASVNCQGKSHINPGIEDVTNISLNYANGGFATIHSSWLDPNKVRRMTIVGSRRMILYDDTEPLEKIKIFDKRVETPPHYDTFAEFQYSYHYGDTYSPYVLQQEPLKVETQHFYDCITKDIRCESGGREGLEVVRILEGSSTSLNHNGTAVDLSTLDPVQG